jgi:flagellar biosynthesis protein FlhB
MPKLSKLNPISGMKRLFSTRALVEVAKSILKIAIVGTMAYNMLKKELDVIPSLVFHSVPDILAFMGKGALNLGFYTCLVLIIMATLDLFYQRWQHERDLRMTKQEVKDEHKEKEGDPMVRSRIRAVQREMAMRRMMDAVPDATVVITNPTHLAVVLKFERDMPAPQVVAKGAGLIAQRIKDVANEHNIPIIEQKPLARALFKSVEIEQYIPGDLYHAVAEILAYVYRLKGLAH